MARVPSIVLRRIGAGMAHYLTYNEIGITIAAIGILFAFVAVAWKATEAMAGFSKAFKRPETERINEHDNQIQDHEERITHLEECCEEVHGKLANDYEFQKNASETNRLLLKSIKQLLKHSIDGEDIDGLQMMEDAIDNYLLEHQK